MELRWKYHCPSGLTQWYGNVEIHGSHVIGQWFVVDATTGAELWAHPLGRPNTISAVVADIIVATEIRSDGPWTLHFGIYGIDLSTGQVRWTNHGSGTRGRLARLLDFIPGFTNEIRDSPVRVVDGLIHTSSGRLLDPASGELRGSAPAADHAHAESPSGPAETLYREGECTFPDGRLSASGHGPDFTLTGSSVHDSGDSSRDSSDNWHFHAAEHGLHVDGNYFSYRYHDGRCYVIAGDGPATVPIRPSQPYVVKPASAAYTLLIIDSASGDLQQHALWDGHPRTTCRIETIHAHTLLVSADGTELASFDL